MAGDAHGGARRPHLSLAQGPPRPRPRRPCAGVKSPRLQGERYARSRRAGWPSAPRVCAWTVRGSRSKRMAIQVGTVYRWRADALGIAADTHGVCYAELGETCAGVLWETGIPSALTDVELNRYAENLGCAPAMAFYRY